MRTQSTSIVYRLLAVVLLAALLLAPAPAAVRAQDPGGGAAAAAAPATEPAAPDGGRLVLLSKLDGPALPADLKILEEYDAFVLAQVSDARLAALPAANIMDQMTDRTVISLNGWVWDTQTGEPAIPESLRAAKDDPYFLIQFYAPIKQEWVENLKAMGVTVLDYIANYAYLVKMDPALVAQVQAAHAVQWVGRYHTAYRLPSEEEMAAIERRPARPEASIILGADGLPVEEQPTVEKDGNRLEFDVVAFTFEDAAALQPRLEAAGVTIVAPPTEIPWTRVLAGRDQLPSLAALRGVRRIELYVQPTIVNDGATQTAHTREVWKAGRNGQIVDLMGKGQTAGLLDSGLDNNQTGTNVGINDFKDFTNGTTTGRVTYNAASAGCGANCIATDAYNGHGTHVAGSIVGNGYNALAQRNLTGYATAADPSFDYAFAAGQAPEANIAVVHTGSNSTSVYLSVPADWVTLYNAGARATNNSWGNAVTTYGGRASTADYHMWSYQAHLLVVAAGNAGPAGMTVTQPGNAKNVISVGASGNHRSTWSGTSETTGFLTDFSAHGPINGQSGSFKPDIIAPGADILSTRTTQIVDTTNMLWGNEPGNANFPDSDGDGDDDGHLDYVWGGGTSNAAPQVTGAAIVARQYYYDIKGFSDSAPPSAALLKATLLNGAVDMGYGYENSTSSPFGGRNWQGWGMLNLEQAITPRAPRSFFYDDYTNITNTRLQSTIGLSVSGRYVEYTNVYVADSSEPLKVTLTWTDYQSDIGTTYNVNNLNLTVTPPGGGSAYLGNVFSGAWSTTGGTADGMNNTESVYIQNPAQGNWTIRVTLANAPTGTYQPYALFVSGGLGVTPSWSSTCSWETCDITRTGASSQAYYPSIQPLTGAPEYVVAGDSFDTTFRVTNWGTTVDTISLSSAVTDMTGVSASGISVSLSPAGPLSLASGASQDVVATVSAGSGTAGAYDVSLVATSSGTTLAGEPLQAVAAMAAPAAIDAVSSEYTWSATNGSYAPVSGTSITTSCTNQVYNNSGNGYPLGFTFNYNGTDYTSVSVACDGWLALGASIAGSTTPLSTGTTNQVVSALGTDLATNTSTSGIRYTTTGSSGSYVFTVEWYNFGYSGASSEAYNFQIKLYEADGKVAIVYGAFTKNTTSRTAQVGLRGATNADYNNRTCSNCANWANTSPGSANTSTMTLSSSYRPATDLTWTWAPKPNLSTSTKTAPASAMVGNNVGYTIRIVNTGSAAATSTTMTDPIPTNATYNADCSASSGACNYLTSPNRIEWTGNVAAGATVTVQFSVDTDSVSAGTMTNQATISQASISNVVVSASTWMWTPSPRQDVRVLGFNVVADNTILPNEIPLGEDVVSTTGPQVSPSFWAVPNTPATMWVAYLSGEDHLGAGSEVYVAQSTDSGATWTKAQVDYGNGRHIYAPAIAGNQAGDLVTVAWIEYTANTTSYTYYVYANTYNGTSWTGVKQLASYTPFSSSYAVLATGPAVAYDVDTGAAAPADGVVFWSLYDSAYGYNNIYFSTSTDSGSTWSSAASANMTGGNGLYLYPVATTDTVNNHVWLVWSRYSNGYAYAGYWNGSTNGWVTTTGIAVSSTLYTYRPTIAYVNGKLWAAWGRSTSSTPPTTQLYYAPSSGTLPTVTFPTAYGPYGARTAQNTAPSITGNSTDVYIAYLAYTDSFRGGNVYVLKVDPTNGAYVSTYQASATVDDPPLYARGNAGTPRLQWATTVVNDASVTGPTLVYSKNPPWGLDLNYGALGASQTLYNVEENFDLFLTQIGNAPTAVELRAFAAEAGEGAVTVSWETVSEEDVLGFNLYRDTSAAGPGVKLNAGLIRSQGPGSPRGYQYSYLDAADLVPGAAYWYWLEDLSMTGEATRHDPVSVIFATEPTAVGLAGFGGASALSAAWPAVGLALAALAAAATATRRRKDEG